MTFPVKQAALKSYAKIQPTGAVAGFIGAHWVYVCLCYRDIFTGLLHVTLSWWWFQIFFIFTPFLGEMIQFDEHIFQMGWLNHQPVVDIINHPFWGTPIFGNIRIGDFCM